MSKYFNNKFRFNFQLFAEGDGSTSTPAATGAAMNTNVTTQGAPNDLSPEMKTFYDKVLLRAATPKLVHDQFAQKRPIPQGNGKTIEFRKFGSLGKILTPLTEGVTPDGQKYSVSKIEATIAQYGGYIVMSDLLNLTAFDNNSAEVMKMLGEQAGRTSDTITREVLNAGTAVLYAGSKTSRATIANADKLTIGDIKKAVRQLKRHNCPTINGDYIAIVHPDTTYDLMNDSEWVEAQKYQHPEKIYEGEIGKMFGVRFIESTEAKIFGKAGASNAPVYSTLVFGENAYGVTSIGGRGIETIVKQLGSSGVADALNQRSSMGWKMNKVAKILDDERMVRIEHGCSLGDTSEEGN